MRRSWWTGWCLAAVLGGSGCIATTGAPIVVGARTGTPIVAGATTAGSTVTKEQVQGHWTCSWGDMVLRVVGNEVWGAYAHDEGTVVGSFEDGVLRGWWSEVPSRAPNADAGEVEFRFVRGADGQLTLDGRWRYGTGDWHEDWDLSLVPGAADPALDARFANPAAFVRHP